MARPETTIRNARAKTLLLQAESIALLLTTVRWNKESERLMKLFGLNLTGILARLKQRPPDPPAVTIRVSNLTRRTHLADRVQLAGNGRDRRKGLLGREHLPNGEGLWIVPCEAVHTFGMRFAIDLVYLDRKHRVVKTRSQVRPGRMSACLTAHSVIELFPGAIRYSRTMRGDTIVFDYGSDEGHPS